MVARSVVHDWSVTFQNFTRDMAETQQRPRAASDAAETARSRTQSRDALRDLTAAMGASLEVSEAMREIAKTTTEAARRSGIHALIVSCAALAATAVSSVIAIIALHH